MRKSIILCLAFAVLSLALDRSTASSSSSSSSSSESIGNNDDATGSSSGSPDSRLERVYVKQETGFDGKVHSIRFSLDPVEADTRLNERQPRLSTATMDATFGRQSKRPARLTDISEKRINAFDDASLSTASEPKSKRSLDQQAPTVNNNNDFHDLDVAESKVFRPLFVYRQQVARRLKARNDRRDRASKRSSKSQPQTPQSQRRARPSIYNYYYPNSYFPYTY
ncbi:hypothetical protein TKK_0004513 [Trichogramma kaykai]|uniref:Uncharacterized protein n=1 Tax=Trichogramma kaykai TaxID=54128 RepID=A0ABD2XNN5_9HYME